jgi:hypothetical protein
LTVRSTPLRISFPSTEAWMLLIAISGVDMPVG